MVASMDSVIHSQQVLGEGLLVPTAHQNNYQRKPCTTILLVSLDECSTSRHPLLGQLQIEAEKFYNQKTNQVFAIRTGRYY